MIRRLIRYLRRSRHPAAIARRERSKLARSAYNEAQARNRKRAMEMIPLLRKVDS